MSSRLKYQTRRSLHRERGLKFIVDWRQENGNSVAPYTGSVDWNHTYAPDMMELFASLPTQGAWIEMQTLRSVGKKADSRSLHRERGLKFIIYSLSAEINRSLPTQGAWIEIQSLRKVRYPISTVAPYTGSVDWNSDSINYVLTSNRRSLHRERGLKFKRSLSLSRSVRVAPYTGSVDWNHKD